jgi:aromatic ring-opening dioxygenase catalytic subunit (LigB family)
VLIPRVLLAPHAATLLLDERRRHRTEMLEAYAVAARALEAERPEAIVALSARWEAPGPFLVDGARRHTTLTDYYGFGVEVRYDCHGAPKLAEAVVATARAAGVRAATTTRGVDSGVSVPLHFLAAKRLYPVVPVSLGTGPAAAHRAWGRALRQAIDAVPERVAFVAGGMLSHNVHAWNLRRETPEAQDFDGRALAALAAGAWGELARLAMRRHARACPEANLLHLEVLHGLLGEDLPGRLLCYEPGPGVGAALVEFLVGEPAALPEPVAEAAPAARHDPRLHVPVRIERPLHARPVSRRPRRAAAERPARRPTGGPPRPRPGAGSGPRPFARAGERPAGRPPRSGPPRSGAPRSGAPRSGPPRSGPPRSGPPRSGAPRSGPPRSGAPRSGPPRYGAPRSGAPRSGPPRSGPPRSGAPRSGPPRSGPPRSGPPRYGAPRSGPPRSGPPRSGPPRSGPPRSGPPRSGPPRSGPPRGGPPRSGPPRSGPPRSGSPRSGSPRSGSPRSGPPRGRGPRPGPRPGRG